MRLSSFVQDLHCLVSLLFPCGIKLCSLKSFVSLHVLHVITLVLFTKSGILFFFSYFSVQVVY